MHWVLICLLALALGGPVAAAPFVWEGAPQPVMQQTQPQRESSSSSRTRVPIKGIIAVIAIVLAIGGWVVKKITGKKNEPVAQVYQQAQAPMQQGGAATGPRPVGQRPQGAPAARPANPAAPGQRPPIAGQRPQGAPAARPANPAAPGQRPPAASPGQRPQQPPQRPGGQA